MEWREYDVWKRRLFLTKIRKRRFSTSKPEVPHCSKNKIQIIANC
jgi:hypothetical protein